MTRRSVFHHALALLGICFLLVAPASATRASTLTVIGDVNAGSGDNLQLYTNVLNGGEKVVFARTFGVLSGVVGHYRSLGATVSEFSGLLSDSALQSVDLLVLTTNYNTALTFTLPELEAARRHADDGGAILMVVEAASGTALTSYSDVIAGLGGYIRFTGERFTSTETLTDLPDTPLSVGLTSFRLSPYNTLTGGTPVVVASNGVAIAMETLGAPPVPIMVPPALPMLAGAFMMLGVLRKGRRRR